MGSRQSIFHIDEEEMDINVDTAAEKLRQLKKEEKISLVISSASVFLFPHPVKELEPVTREVGASVMYDAAYVAELIARVVIEGCGGRR